MRKKGTLAMTLFALASFSGVVALFSQAAPRAVDTGRREYHDLAPVEASVLRQTLPAAIRRGATSSASRHGEGGGDGTPPRRLTLR